MGFENFEQDTSDEKSSSSLEEFKRMTEAREGKPAQHPRSLDEIKGGNELMARVTNQLSPQARAWLNDPERQVPFSLRVKYFKEKKGLDGDALETALMEDIERKAARPKKELTMEEKLEKLTGSN
jgi:hypothetical protein